MRDVVALPGLDEVWTRWALLASVLAATGPDGMVWVDGDGAHHDDAGGNWSRLVRLDGGRAAWFGYDHEQSDTVNPRPPVDVLDGAPPWAPMALLVPLSEQDLLAYAYWWSGSGWTRADYDVADGLEASAPHVFDDDGVLGEIGEWLRLGGDPRPATRPLAVAALDAARARRVTRDVLATLVGSTGDAVERALAQAATAGLTAGSGAPVTAVAASPATRRRRRLGDQDHDRLVHEAMRAAVELDRPDPPATKELDRLVKWLRKHGGKRGAVDVTVEAGGPSLTVRMTPDGGGLDELRRLASALRQAEADPEGGRWLYLRVLVEGRAVHVERAWDSWPAWCAPTPGSGPWIQDLREELSRRGPDWQPPWAGLLDEATAWEVVAFP